MDKKRIKTNIGVGSIVKGKVGEMEDTTREVRIRRMRKEVMGCVQAVVGKKIFLVQFENGQKKRYELFFVCVCMFERGGMP